MEKGEEKLSRYQNKGFREKILSAPESNLRGECYCDNQLHSETVFPVRSTLILVQSITVIALRFILA